MAEKKKTDDESKEEKKAKSTKSKKSSSSKSKKSSAAKSKAKKADDEKTETDAKEAKKKPARSRSRSRKKADDDKAEATEATEATEASETADAADEKEEKAAKSKSKSKSRAKKSSSSKSKKSSASKSKSKSKKAKKDDDSEEESKPKSTDEVIAAATEFLGGVFERMGLEVKIVGKSEDGKAVSVDLQGEDAETLLGAGKASPRSLDALQTIARGAITDGTGFHLNLDIGGFREKRTDRLRDVAQQLVAAAAKVEQPIVLAGFNSFERRVIHKTLENEKSVKTESEGYGAFRKLRVEPN